MSELLCIQWNDFKENINSAFRSLRNDKEFTDVTLVCEDGQQMEAHKIILASSSPFFEKIVQKSKHPHPLIYLRGIQSKHFELILDFLYFGETKICQEDLDSFLAIAEEIQLTGLTRQTSCGLMEQERNQHGEPVYKSKDLFDKSSTCQTDKKHKENVPSETFTELAITNQSKTDLLDIDEKVKSIMEKGQKMMPDGKQLNGSAKMKTSHICKLCGKEGLPQRIKLHIEASHLEGISIPCDVCGKTYPTRNSLSQHKNRYHK